ncbi:DUF2158 domain-containing protein [Dyella jejuensis]|uniref:DUF2158 domain-containing protein n=1 Tax=Dyella jejuensis TaxID=1432009 RepID=A0ABW8JJ34_9GAMM
MAKQGAFKLGDIVKLKSGGPDMTVNEILLSYPAKQPTGEYRCQWFAGKKLDTGVFPVESLEPVQTEK